MPDYDPAASSRQLAGARPVLGGTQTPEISSLSACLRWRLPSAWCACAVPVVRVGGEDSVGSLGSRPDRGGSLPHGSSQRTSAGHAANAGRGDHVRHAADDLFSVAACLCTGCRMLGPRWWAEAGAGRTSSVFRRVQRFSAPSFVAAALDSGRPNNSSRSPDYGSEFACSSDGRGSRCSRCAYYERRGVVRPARLMLRSAADSASPGAFRLRRISPQKRAFR